MKITFFGGTGFVGKALLKKAIDAGHEITVLARNPDKLGVLKNSVECIEGDYFDASAIRKALVNSEAVLSCIGPPLGLGRGKFVGKYPKAMQMLVSEMENAGTTRIITIAGASVPIPGTELPALAKIIRVAMALIGGRISKDKDQEALILSQSNLDWTILRPPGIKPRKNGVFTVSETELASPFVDVHQLCQFMLDSLSDKNWIQKAPFTGTK